MMDRMWTYWQLLEPKTRFTEPEMNGGDYGHITWANAPPARLAHFNDTIDLGYAGPPTTIGEVMSTTKGAFCYFYL
jgi:tyrosinase